MQKRDNLKVIWSPRALRDVHDLGDYLVQFMSVAKIENKSVRIARVLHEKQDIAAALSANPMSPLL